MNRSKEIKKVSENSAYDIVVIGGGASGLGAAVDAASRGYKTLLLESHDFAKGTSSRSTKLVHGGVRYLQQGNISLVREALKERGLLAKNAAHLVRTLDFVIPNYKWWQGYYYNFGLWLYDRLAGSLSLGKTRRVNKEKTIQRIGNIEPHELKSGVIYTDGQFDDSRLAISLAQTIIDEDGTAINYMKVTDLLKDDQNKVIGVAAEDQLGDQHLQIKAKAVINATGIFTDDVLNMNNPDHQKMIMPSQGVHLVMDKSFLDGDDAIMIPKTSDGRVLFVVPWHHRVLVGTTDTLMKEGTFEPKALKKEINFILSNARQYLSRKPTKDDIKAVYAGMRPLAAPKEGSKKTKEVSRSHKVIVDKTGLITLTGGKWTTYRKMAEDVIDKAIEVHRLEKRACKTENLSIHGNLPQNEVDMKSHLYVYGSDIPKVRALEKETPLYAERLHPDHDNTVAEVIWALREEMAERLEDVLARRTRLLFLDAKAAIDIAPKVAEVIKEELQWTDQKVQEEIKDFTRVAQNYLIEPYRPKKIKLNY